MDQVLPEVIPAGSRNATLSQKAGCLIKRYGDTAKARELFQAEADRCDPPLPDSELEQIWSSAKKFGKRVAGTEGYIPPEQFNAADERLAAMHPESNRLYSWSDIGASRLFADYYQDIARYVPERKSWYCYDDGVWRADVGNLRTMELCKQLANALMLYGLSIPDEQKRQEYIKYCSKWQTRRVRETILRDAQGIYPKVLKTFFGEQHNKNVSAVIYLTSGLVGILAVLSLVMPFSCSADFLDSIVLKRNLSDSEFTLKFAFYTIIMCMVSGSARWVVIRKFTYESNKKIRHVYTHAYALDDIVDLTTAVASLLFIISVFLQIYHTGMPFVSMKAGAVYIWVLYKFLRLLYVFFANSTLKIIDKVCKDYPDME